MPSLTPAASSGRRQRLSVSDRRRQIAEQGVDLVARYGSYGFTMQHVADAVGLSLPGLLHHVRNREELLAMIIELHFDRQPDESDHIGGSPSSAGSLPRFLREIVRRNVARPQLTALYLLLAVESRNPDHPAHSYYASRHERILNAFAARLWDLPERYRDERPLGDLVRTALASLDGVQLQALTDPREDALGLWDRVERILFGAAEWDGYR